MILMIPIELTYVAIFSNSGFYATLHDRIEPLMRLLWWLSVLLELVLFAERPLQQQRKGKGLCEELFSILYIHIFTLYLLFTSPFGTAQIPLQYLEHTLKPMTVCVSCLCQLLQNCDIFLLTFNSKLLSLGSHSLNRKLGAILVVDFHIFPITFIIFND